MTARRHPSGTVTLLFTDVEGSTRLLRAQGPGTYAEVLAEHREVLRGALRGGGGVEVDTQGDAFFFAFADPTSAVEAAARAVERLAPGPMRVRFGIHTGTPLVTDEGYVGLDVHVAARIAAAAHGDQILISGSTRVHLRDDASVVDLGEHRLKDLDEPVRIHQYGARAFPPVRTIANTNLPSPPGSFVGREHDVREVLDLVERGGRLVTLIGPGGVGKSRLAIAVGRQLLTSFPDGAFWVPLAALRDPTDVPRTIAIRIGARADLGEHLAERRVLLVLDNFEHVMGAASALADLLGACPDLHVVVTSRELLRLAGELVHDVAPLREAASVQLFAERSGLPPDDRATELCRQLDHLPLAIELAAATARTVGTGLVLDRLSGRLDLLRGARDAEHRQRSLRATIEWSHDLLEPHEQESFARMSVFRGSTTLEGAEAVCPAGLVAVSALVEKSLLRHTGQRYSMLETIRTYAAERLDESGLIGDARDRHAAYHLELVEDAASHLVMAPDPWMERIDLGLDDIRAAHDRLVETGRSQNVLTMVGALWRYWISRGLLAEGRSALEEAIARDASPTSGRARALIGAAVLADYQGDAEVVRARAEEAIALGLELTDGIVVAFARFLIGGYYAELGHFTAARDVFERSVQAFRELGDEHHTLVATRAWAWTCEELGDVGRYDELHTQNLHRARAIGDRRMVARSLGALAASAIREGRSAEALAMQREMFSIDLALGDRVQLALDLCRIAATHATGGDAEMAARLLAKGEASHTEMGADYESWALSMNENTRRSLLERLGPRAFAEATTAGWTMSVEELAAQAFGVPVETLRSA